MQENSDRIHPEVTGLVLQSTPMGEYDRRVVLLTKERGRISAFARGARRPGSSLMGSAQPFCFGKFRLYEGRNSYTLLEARVDNYFDGVKADVLLTCYASYFMEILSYYSRENNDETLLLVLAYCALRALEAGKMSSRLIRCVFEMKTIMIEGEFPGLRREKTYSKAAEYTVNFVMNHEINGLFSFNVTDPVLDELEEFCAWLCKRTMKHRFLSLEILGMMSPGVEKNI